MARKKRVLFQTDYTLAKTGFGRNARDIFEYLYKTGKYDLINFAVGSVDSQMGNEVGRTPWKTIPGVNAHQIEELKRNNDPKNWENIERMGGYGAFSLDRVVKEEKPDVFFGVQDIWGIDFSINSVWFNKITSVLWTTLDSLPILPKAVEIAPQVKNYWCWADFATQALHQLGHTHVKTVRGALNPNFFYRLPDKERLDLRKKFGIPEKAFIPGFVFRNQLRKSVPNLLQGYKTFRKNNPKAVARLYLHTCWAEGWDIPKLIEENEIPNQEIITTYICKNCRSFHVAPFTGHELNCPYCHAEKQQVTTHPSVGVSEEQLNQIYNLMDVYVHPFTSGGQEIPIQEAKLTELVTLVTKYSCGEDMCVPEAGSLPLAWAEYREPGTQFIKASTNPTDIARQLDQVFLMKDTTRRALGRKGREWVLENFSIDVIGKFLENFIDSAPFSTDEAFADNLTPRDPNAVIPEIANGEEWLITLYRDILKRDDVKKNDEGLKYWLSRLQANVPRPEIEKFFRQTAVQENAQLQTRGKDQFEGLLNADDKGRVLVVQPESAGDIFLLSSVFASIKRRYPDWTLYVATKPEYRDIVEGNPLVGKWLPYHPMMDNVLWLEGNNTHKGYFNIAYHPYVQTQKTFTYTHNGLDTLDFDIHTK
jgi:glycosyltransferase involved in cell wall biosynthesis